MMRMSGTMQLENTATTCVGCSFQVDGADTRASSLCRTVLSFRWSCFSHSNDKCRPCKGYQAGTELCEWAVVTATYPLENIKSSAPHWVCLHWPKPSCFCVVMTLGLQNCPYNSSKCLQLNALAAPPCQSCSLTFFLHVAVPELL